MLKLSSFWESVVFDLKLVHLTFFGEVSSFLEGRVGQGQEDWTVAVAYSARGGEVPDAIVISPPQAE